MKKHISKLTAVALTVASGLLVATDARANLIGGPDIIAAPAYALNAKVTNTHMQAFNEAQDVVLAAALAVDGGTIAAGTVVDSHMIFLNIPKTMASASDKQTWTFDGLILGVMSDRNGTLEAASSAFLGAAGTQYPAAGFSNRGLERGDSYVVNGNQITVDLTVTQPGDWIRVVTQSVGVPDAASTISLLGLGMLGLAAGSFRRSK